MKRMFLIGVIVYSAASLVLLHWPAMAMASGIQASGPFLGLMVLDLLFAGAAFVKMGLFATLDEDEDDEDAVHSRDVDVPAYWLYGAFGLNLFANAGWHAYKAMLEVGVDSVFFSIWFMAEVVALILTAILFKHAWDKHASEIAKARKEARAAATPISKSRNVA